MRLIVDTMRLIVDIFNHHCLQLSIVVNHPQLQVASVLDTLEAANAQN